MSFLLVIVLEITAWKRIYFFFKREIYL